MPNLEIESLHNLIAADIAGFSLHLEQNTPSALWAQEIIQAHCYPLLAGGKRVRPLLVLLVAGAIGGDRSIEMARKSALAVELIHTYSLVHDDLPCMDNDDLRRGAPTTHKVYGEAKALLVGDGLLTQAFAILARTSIANIQKKHFVSFLIEALAECAGSEGMVWGQWLDLSYTGDSSVSWEQIELIHRNKTGKLIGGCLELGLICGIANMHVEISNDIIKNLRKKIREAGVLIGLSFQMIDDILDATKSTQELGKTAAKDERQNKVTALSLLGQQKAEELSRLYTEKAILLVNEVLNDKLFMNAKNTEQSYFQDHLFKQIYFLLSRNF